jgi:hypothetical protein
MYISIQQILDMRNEYVSNDTDTSTSEETTKEVNSSCTMDISSARQLLFAPQR